MVPLCIFLTLLEYKMNTELWIGNSHRDVEILLPIVNDTILNNTLIHIATLFQIETLYDNFVLIFNINGDWYVIPNIV
jgi:hypothetical protein